MDEGPTSTAAANETGGPPELSPIFLYMRTSIGISPEAPDLDQAEYTATIPNGFVQDGPFGRGILPFMGHVQWREVGTWNTEPVKNTINLGGQVRIVMYVKGNPSNSGTVSSDFEFIITRAGESAPILQLTKANVRIPSGTSGDVGSFDVLGNFPFTNDTTINAGTAMSLRIRARCNGGAILVFGSSSYSSGVGFDTNSLAVHSLHMCRDGVTVEYRDAFYMSWMRLDKRLTINALVQDNSYMKPDINSVNSTRVLFWPLEVSPGSYEVSANLSYNPEGAGVVSKSEIFRIEEEFIPPFTRFKMFVSSISIYLILILFITIMLLFVRKQRLKTWKRRVRTLPPDERGKSFRKQKRAWKARNKEEKRDRNAQRAARNKEDEEERAESGFSIFRKKKDAKPPRPHRKRPPAKTVEVIEEGDKENVTLEGLGELDLDL
ncbi:MAG: hypothetical protein QCI82_07435 [Candidatus Thermoplasmatota archaeon]|nr:hypothetical protein [Candidatus Thermoplasmatota archaeon]